MLSVIICTHNPREDYLRRVLAGLRSQTLPMAEWELLLVDNASEEPLSKSWDISWHTNARHVREEKPGLTHARLCGIRESHGGLLVFVDDDNVLSNDYLYAAIEISRSHLQIGAFGASLKGEFEGTVAKWMEPYVEYLAIRELECDYWSNLPNSPEALPIGAGLCIRRLVAEDYERKTFANPLRSILDRTGKGLGGHGDFDLAWCAIDLGMGTGRFQALRLTHLIPSLRLTKDYIRRLVAGQAASGVILDSLRPRRTQESKTKTLLRLGLQMLSASPFERRLLLIAFRERQKAHEFLSGKRTSIEF